MSPDTSYLLMMWCFAAIASGFCAPAYYDRWTKDYPPLHDDPYIVTMALIVMTISLLGLVMRLYDYVVTPDRYEEPDDSWFHR